MIHVSFQGSIDNVSEETRHTILLYHQVSKAHFSHFTLWIVWLTSSSVLSLPPGHYYSPSSRSDLKSLVGQKRTGRNFWPFPYP